MTAWLESLDMPEPLRALQPRTPCPFPAAVRAWNLMGGALDIAAMPTLAEVLRVRDPERWLAQLETLREHQRARAQAQNA